MGDNMVNYSCELILLQQDFPVLAAKMLISFTDFIVSAYNLTCHLRMLTLIANMIFVTMDTNW